MASLEVVRTILSRLNINKPEFFDLLTVRQVLKKLSIFLCLVPDELPDALIINQTCERVVSMLKECLRNEDAAGPVVHQLTPSNAAPHNTPKSPGVVVQQSQKDMNKAWEIIQNKSKIKPESVDSLVTLLEELGVDSAESLNDIDDADYEQIAQMLKKAGAKGFLKAVGVLNQ